MSAPILALLNLAPLRSNRLRRAMTRAPEKLAPLNVGASAREVSNPDERTRPRRLAFDRSALVKFARIIQARSSFALERFAPEKSAPSNFAPKKFAPDRLTPLKSELLRSRFSSDFPERSAGLSGAAAASISRTCSALRSAPRAGDSESTSNTHTKLRGLSISVTSLSGRRDPFRLVHPQFRPAPPPFWR